MAKRCTTGDPTYDLVAAVYRQALADAQRGDASASAWLAVVAPDAVAPGKRKRKQRTRRGKSKAVA